MLLHTVPPVAFTLFQLLWTMGLVTVGLVQVLPWHEMNFRDNVLVIPVLTLMDSGERSA